MEILPPRRRGQLGAITAGAGVQGPSGGFSIQASSVAKASSSPAPVKNPVAPKGSVAPPVTPSVSEQVALKQSTSQAAAAKTMPAFSQGGTYSSNQAVVGVKGEKIAVNRRPDEEFGLVPVRGSPVHSNLYFVRHFIKHLVSSTESRESNVIHAITDVPYN